MVINGAAGVDAQHLAEGTFVSTWSSCCHTQQIGA